jgi:histone H3/H4
MPPIPPLPASHSFAHNPTSTPYYTQQPLKSEPSFLSNPASYPSYDGAEDYPTMSRNPRIKDESAFAAAAAPKYKDPNPNNIEIKTKFPVARIKRIMQADEEVGKVAQVTPVAVNKALELFMIALVGRAAEKAREKGGKRVTAQHLKMVVEGDEQFDFLGEIVGRVAEVTEGAGGEGRKRKEKVLESGSESEEKKPKKGKGRRKKSDD